MVCLISQEPAGPSPPAWSRRPTTCNLTNDPGTSIPAAGRPSVYDPRLTINVSEPLVRHPGVGWNGAASPRQPCRAIGLSK
jgi:hypothetical protein